MSTLLMFLLSLKTVHFLACFNLSIWTEKKKDGEGVKEATTPLDKDQWKLGDDYGVIYFIYYKIIHI